MLLVVCAQQALVCRRHHVDAATAKPSHYPSVDALVGVEAKAQST
jgi:hypothetical protein